jgi:peptidoglycan-associated lipoprotein
MKFKYLGTGGLIAAMTLLAACATTEEEPVVVETPAEPEVVEPQMSDMERMTMELEQEVGHRVFYAYDSSALNGEAQATLRRQAQWMMQPANSAVRVRLAGNCDERGTREYNLALGARRAEAAKDYLVQLGVPATRISTISYGKERPIDPRSTPDAWARNRNATTTIVSVDGMM